MSKTEPQEDLGKEIARLNQELRAKDKQIKGYKGQIGVLRGQNVQKKPETSEPEPPASPPKPEEAHDIHFVKPYDRVCTTCGEKNAEFKDETQCDGCGKHLGAIASIQKVKACPDCGSKSAHPLRDLTPEEAKLFEH